ncbi:MAG TPA: CoA transferase, partial [Burkholderiales bacterium]|nr:CoA transferase [Burkholderiales bacterium]
GTHGTRAGVSIADMTAGMYCAYAVMLALRVKDRTGVGQQVDISMMEGQLALLGTQIANYFADGKVPEPMGNAYSVVVPYQTFHTRTRDLALAIAGEKLWKKFCPIMGCPELLEDPRYRNTVERSRHRDTLIPTLQAVFMTRSYEEWEAILLENDIPVGAINNLAQVVEHPQVKARQSLRDVDHPSVGRVRVVGSPVRLSKTPAREPTPSPVMGQHTREVLQEVLGLSADEVAKLEAAGVVAAAPPR